MTDHKQVVVKKKMIPDSPAFLFTHKAHSLHSMQNTFIGLHYTVYSIMKHNMLIYVKHAPFTSVRNIPCSPLTYVSPVCTWHDIVINVHEWQRNTFIPRLKDYGFGHKLYSMNV